MNTTDVGDCRYDEPNDRIETVGNQLFKEIGFEDWSNTTKRIDNTIADRLFGTLMLCSADGGSDKTKNSSADTSPSVAAAADVMNSGRMDVVATALGKLNEKEREEAVRSINSKYSEGGIKLDYSNGKLVFERNLADGGSERVTATIPTNGFVTKDKLVAERKEKGESSFRPCNTEEAVYGMQNKVENLVRDRLNSAITTGASKDEIGVRLKDVMENAYARHGSVDGSLRRAEDAVKDALKSRVLNCEFARTKDASGVEGLDVKLRTADGPMAFKYTPSRPKDNVMYAPLIETIPKFRK